MEVTHFIGKHLVVMAGSIKGYCCFCGASTNVLPRRDVLSSNFNDWQHVKYNSKYVCMMCAACLGSQALDGKALRNYSFIATNDKLITLQLPEISSCVLTPPEPPFVFVVTFTHKKHIVFHACLNHTKDLFTIATDKGNIEIVLGSFRKLYGTCQKLYDYGFSKVEMRSGGYKKWAKMDNCGTDFWSLDNDIKKYRNTFYLEFLLHILQKSEEDNDKT